MSETTEESARKYVAQHPNTRTAELIRIIDDLRAENKALVHDAQTLHDLLGAKDELIVEARDKVKDVRKAIRDNAVNDSSGQRGPLVRDLLSVLGQVPPQDRNYDNIHDGHYQEQEESNEQDN